MAAAVPLAIKAGSMIAAHYAAKKLSGPSKEQKAAMTQGQQGGQALTAAGQPLLSQGLQMAQGGTGDLDAAGNYYRNILGSRIAARESLAPEMSTALSFYRGAENKAKRTLRGGSRDVALAELDREKVGRMATMLPEARRLAAQGATDVGATRLSGGTSLTGQGVNALANAGYAQNQLFGQATTLEGQAREGGKAWGGLIYDVANQVPWGKMGGSPTPAPNPYGVPGGLSMPMPAPGAKNPYYQTAGSLPAGGSASGFVAPKPGEYGYRDPFDWRNPTPYVLH